MLLSIITINYNNCEGLRKTVASVVSQTFRDFEWIVIDGGSTDGSKELIEQYADHFSYWVSEPDKGIYNAMNKGIRAAKGDYLLFLNSGDWLIDDDVLLDFSNNGFAADIVDGNIHLIYEDREEDAFAPKRVDFDFFKHGTLWHPCAFIKKSLFDKCGCYNEEFRVISDWEFFMRAVTINGASYERFNRIVSCFPVNGISADPLFEQEKKQDRRNAYLKFVPESFLDAYEKLDNEARRLREVKREYDMLKDGRLGFLVRLASRLKGWYHCH